MLLYSRLTASLIVMVEMRLSYTEDVNYTSFRYIVYSTLILSNV